MVRIARDIDITADPEKVFAALSTTTGLSGWWTRTCTAGAVGETAEFRFRGGEVLFRMQVEALDEGQRVRWLCVENKAIPEWENTTIEFTLKRPVPGATTLTFVHDGWNEESEWFEHCSDGWDYFLRSLKAFVETGTGTPDAGGRAPV